MMKSMRSLVLFGGMVLVLCCISTSVYASSDKPVSIPTPVCPFDPQSIIVIGENDGILEYLGEVEPIGGFEPWIEPMDFVPGYGGQLNLEDIEHAEPVFLPERPRYIGFPPLDMDGSLFDSYDLSTNSYGIAPSFDVTSSSGGVGPVNVIPEPATVLLLGLGAFLLRHKAV